MKKETEIIRADWRATSGVDSYPGILNPPVGRASTVLFRDYAEMRRAVSGEYSGPVYGTDRLPVQRTLEQDLCGLEGGAACRVFPSGLAAIRHAVNCFVKSGDHLLVVDNAYGPGMHYCTGFLKRYNISSTVVPPNVGEDIAEYIRPETRFILLESPGSNTFEIQDIPAITAIARQRGIVTAVDNTWATPLYFRPFEHGVDISIQSVTKYISGHSDVLMGSVTANADHAEALTKYYGELELYVPEEDCALTLRGMKTLAVRLRQHEASALEIASRLESLDKVGEVFHPALPSHPEHALFQRDFLGSSGLFGFTFAREHAEGDLARFVDHFELFGLGFSWGGFKSLLTIGPHKRATPSRYEGKTIVRLNIGLEDPADLWDDLTAAFATLP